MSGCYLQLEFRCEQGSKSGFCAGAGQTALTRSPGDGFATDANLIQKYNLSDPNALFKTLLIRPYVNQVYHTPLIRVVTFASGVNR